MTPDRKPFASHDRWLRKPVTERGIRLRGQATRCGVRADLYQREAKS